MKTKVKETRPHWLKRKHCGVHSNRLSRPWAKGEAVFVREWQKLMEKTISDFDSFDTLDIIMAQMNDRIKETDPGQRKAVNTVIQWLGSSIGLQWLEKVFSKIKFNNLMVKNVGRK
jgi:hypothetical protein